MVDGGDWRALARYLQNERQRGQYRTRRQFAGHIGVSLSTLDNLLGARRSHYSDDTIAAVEIAMAWQRGSVDRVLAGGKPRPVRDPDLERLLRAWARLPIEARRMLVALAENAADGSLS